MTNVLALPPISGSLTLPNNADLRQVWTLGVDLTGIAFAMQIRLASAPTVIALDISTAQGGLANGGSAGTLTLTAPQATVETIAPGAYLADILASAEGHVVNLCGGTPLAVTVTAGVTS